MLVYSSSPCCEVFSANTYISFFLHYTHVCYYYNSNVFFHLLPSQSQVWYKLAKAGTHDVWKTCSMKLKSYEKTPQRIKKLRKKVLSLPRLMSCAFVCIANNFFLIIVHKEWLLEKKLQLNECLVCVSNFPHFFVYLSVMYTLVRVWSNLPKS